MDRTLEYHQIVASRRMGAPPSYKARPPVQKSEFAAAASTIGADIARTAGKLGKLTQLAQSKSLFEDPMAEINELTHIIKQDITALNGKLTGLQGAMADATRPAGKQRASHSTSVVEALKTRLLEATKEFQEVLHTRSHNQQVMQKRREEFSAAAASSSGAGGGGVGRGGGATPTGGVNGAASSAAGGGDGGNMLRNRQHKFAPPTPIFELCAPPPAAAGSSSSEPSSSTGAGCGGFGGGGGAFGGGGSFGASLKHKKDDDYGSFGAAAASWASPAAKPAGMSSGAGGAVVIDMSEVSGLQSQAQEFLPMSGSYLDQRANAVDAVQSTIAELGTIFQQLASMVQVQGEGLQVCVLYVFCTHDPLASACAADMRACFFCCSFAARRREPQRIDRQCARGLLAAPALLAQHEQQPRADDARVCDRDVLHRCMGHAVCVV